MVSAKILSPQQTIIMQHLVNGCTIKEIALQMGLACVTVRKHVNRARHKLGAKTHDHAIALVVALGVVIVTTQ
jgi:DNA-binding CsgD family transcriptional regulator